LLGARRKLLRRHWGGFDMQASLAFMNGAGIRTGKSGRRDNAFLEVLNLLRTSYRALPRRKQRSRDDNTRARSDS
jgi:hypothetical protein